MSETADLIRVDHAFGEDAARAINSHGFVAPSDTRDLYAKVSFIPVGEQIVKHVHDYDHKSFLASGQAMVTVGGISSVYDAPREITVKAGVLHDVAALTDIVWLCVHKTGDKNADTVDRSIVEMRPPIRLLDRGVNVAPIYWALLEHPELWNGNKERTHDPASPHHGLDDIWVRYGAPERTKDDAPHDSFWYPSADILGVKSLCLDIMRNAGGVELGGVLITRIKAGKDCKPHADLGWHAKRYEKFGVQLASAPGQRFCFESAELETRPGDVFGFDNALRHWVVNQTEHERVTMIVCVRLEK